MKRLFYLLFGLVLLPALLYAQGSLSLKDINDNLTNNYYTKTVSDSKYGTTASVALKADKTYVDANFATTAENALKQNIADMVNYYTKTAADLLLADKATTAAVALKQNASDMINYYTKTAVDLLLADKATTGAVALKLDAVTINDYYLKTQTYSTGEIALLLAAKANTADVYDTAAINLLLTDKADTSSVTAVSDLLAAHTGEVSGAHQGSAIAVDSSGFTGNLSLADDTVQKAFAKLDALSGLPATNAITKIYGDSDVDGCETGAVWLVGTNGVQIYRSGNTFEANIENATKFGGYYTKAETNATIEAAIAAIPAPSTNQTVTVTAGEALTAGQVVSLINESGTMKAYNIPLSVSTSPNGAESVFNASATTYCSAVALDSTKFVVIYRSANTDIYAVVGTVSGSSISWGTPVAALQNGDTISACKIDGSTLFVAHYRTSDGYGVCRTVSVSGTVPTWNTTSVFNAEGSYYIKCDLIDSTHTIICFADGGGKNGQSIIATLSGTSISGYGTKAQFDSSGSGDIAHISVSALSSTSAIVAYQDGGDGFYGKACPLSISGTTITPGTEQTFRAASSAYISCVALTSSTASIIYSDGASVRGIVATNNSGISYGAEATINNSGSVSHVSSYFISSTKVIAVFNDDIGGKGNSSLCDINSTSFSIIGSSYIFNAASTANISGCYLGSNKSIISYKDTGNSSYGTAVVNTWATSSYASVSGISSGAYSSGSDAVVLISGVSDDQTDLIVGSPYFLQSDFTIGTTPISLAKYYNSSTATGEIKIGTAKSATELIIGIDYK